MADLEKFEVLHGSVVLPSTEPKGVPVVHHVGSVVALSIRDATRIEGSDGAVQNLRPLDAKTAATWGAQGPGTPRAVPKAADKALSARILELEAEVAELRKPKAADKALSK